MPLVLSYPTPTSIPAQDSGKEEAERRTGEGRKKREGLLREKGGVGQGSRGGTPTRLSSPHLTALLAAATGAVGELVAEV